MKSSERTTSIFVSDVFDLSNIFISELQLACVIVLVPHTVTLIMETASVSRGWLDHTVTSACWDTGVSMNMVASPASVLVIVTLTQETVWLGDYERFCWLFNIFKGHVFLVIFILYVRLQGISESTVVILYLKCKKKKNFLTIFDNWNKAELNQILDLFFLKYGCVQKLEYIFKNMFLKVVSYVH